jgi:hypothetical protein
MLSWRAYENKLKTAYEHVISYLYKFSQTVSQLFMLIDNLK